MTVRWPQLIRSSSGAKETTPGRAPGWESLRKPVPGHSTIDGVPVPVVAVRRNGDTGQLEVVRGFYPTSDWPAATATPPNVKRHILPALSFIPHPRRELFIGGQRFFYTSVPNAVQCPACGSNDNGFGFVRSDDESDSENGRDAPGRRALCELCAEKRAQPVER